MPGLDLSIALTNPLTLDSFDVLRRRQVKNNFGEVNMDVERTAAVKGVVYSESLNDLARRAEAQVTTKSITIITRFALRSEAQDANDNSVYQPDVVLWRGDQFLVVHIEDYSNYAHGFVKATAESMDITDQPPLPTGPSQNLDLPGSGYGYDEYGGGEVPGDDSDNDEPLTS